MRPGKCKGLGGPRASDTSRDQGAMAAPVSAQERDSTVVSAQSSDGVEGSMRLGGALIVVENFNPSLGFLPTLIIQFPDRRCTQPLYLQ